LLLGGLLLLPSLVGGQRGQPWEFLLQLQPQQIRYVTSLMLFILVLLLLLVVVVALIRLMWLEGCDALLSCCTARSLCAAASDQDCCCRC
jgi:hypothetical protein